MTDEPYAEIWEGGLRNDLREVIFDAKTIESKVVEIGQRITKDYADKDPLMLGILKGSYPFLADLTRAVNLPLTVDFMAVSSYGAGTKSSGVVRILKDLDRSIEGRHVIIVEDIIDTGLTLHYLRQTLRGRKPASVEIAALLDKKAVRKGKELEDMGARYVGFECPDEFVVGYGLDYKGRYRNMPFIGVLRPEIYS
ncbi:hypoxanthine phosphoribosyltransferase [Pseudenhygromyxa sp. WMMC2535]|uniref:hypoxanthine phosphoribosyltransferase n=1 Tax=Pseudenhygromyxa sp. WMMC2535 TaxID=2712867 RepID=UPI001554466A|nr:hypoxanthine phosphoribosyltransferase [Pseudenhygromyxa sp. WMMC2535]NVB42722.1 hypoxanthine phosphoribosyltransferase [Pseudenhygromyxa sp. WMMC2535]